MTKNEFRIDNKVRTDQIGVSEILNEIKKSKNQKEIIESEKRISPYN